jgi:rhamnogalacturonan endolyase
MPRYPVPVPVAAVLAPLALALLSFAGPRAVAQPAVPDAGASRRITSTRLPRPAGCRPVDVFIDDFSRYPAGWLSKPVGTLNAAIQEYHYLPHRGVPTAPWANAICHLDAFLAGDEEGVPYLEQHSIADLPDYTPPTFVTGELEWNDYTVETKLKPLSHLHFAGVAFRYQTNKYYYLFALAGGKEARLVARRPFDKSYRQSEWRTIATKPFPYEANRKYYAIKIENEGSKIRAYVDGKLVIEASDEELKGGKVALVASAPARYQGFKVSACPATKVAFDARIKERNDELGRLRADNPQPKLWKRFATPKFGAGRNVRFGDLDGDGQVDMLIAQNIPRVRGDSFDHLSALTAVTLDGRLLWQSGRADPRNGLLTNDTPFQINDIDGDRRNEVVLIRDFKIQVLDGRNGNVKRWVWMPPMKAPPSGPPGVVAAAAAAPPPPAPPVTGAGAPPPARPYELYSGDSIIFANLTGKPGRRDFILKDRYRHVWAYSRDLKLLWEGDEDTGHFPYPTDIDGDGKDELFIGHGMWTHAGKRLWSMAGKLKDHVDAVAVGNFSGDPKAPPRVYWATSDEGFLMLDLKGNVLKHTLVGHTQTVGIGKFRPDLPGLQIVTTNFWRNPGIISVFDAEGNLLKQGEPIHTGSVTLPVNWRGDGQEFVLLSGNVTEGGMIDGQLRRVVMFPDDGHADLTAQVLNVTGDSRDEIILWDESSVWIYTQDGPPPKGRLYAPVRNPNYNDSNYRANISLPGWKEPTAAIEPRP